MKFGVKSLILLVLSISEVAFGSWHTDAWPSTNHYRISSPTNYLQASNLWAKVVTETWSQSSTTNSIEDITVAVSDLGITDYSISWHMPIPAFRWTNTPYEREWTNVYNTVIQTDVSTNTTLTWTNVFYGTNTITNTVAVYSNQVVGTNTLIVTNFIDNVYVTSLYGFETNENKTFGLDVPQIWQWDAYMSIAEREAMLNPSTNGLDVREGGQPRIELYRDIRDSLTGQKAWVKSEYVNFVDMNYASNGTYDAYFATGYTSSWSWADHYIANVAYPSTFPVVSELAVYDKYEMPYELDIRTNQFRVNVRGWFAGQTNMHTVTNYTWTAVWTNGGPTKTWFDYTPYSVDLGGWRPGLSNVVDGLFRFTYDQAGDDYIDQDEFMALWRDEITGLASNYSGTNFVVSTDSRVTTNRWFVNDACGQAHIAESLNWYEANTNEVFYDVVYHGWILTGHGFEGEAEWWSYGPESTQAVSFTSYSLTNAVISLRQFSSVVTNYGFIAENTTYATPLYSPNLQGPSVSATYSNTVEFDSYQRVQNGTNALRYIVFETVSTQRVDVLWPTGTYYETQSLLESSTNLAGYVTNSPAPVITNILFSQVFTNGTVYTQDFTCVNSEIAAGRCEADYGYKYLPDWINELQWTAKADPTYSTIGCDTNPAGLYWMGDGTNNPTITTNTSPSSDLVRITNSVVAPKQWWETVMSTNYAYGDPVTNVITANGAVMFVPASYWDCNTESWYYYGDDFAGVYYDTCDTTIDEILAGMQAWGDYVTYISGCEAYLKEWGSAYFNAEYNEIYGIEPFELECVSTPVYTNIAYSLQSDYKLSDVAFNLLATIESEKVPYYRLSSVSGHQVLNTNIYIYTNVFATNVYISGTNYTYVTNTCCAGYASEYENIHVSGTNYTYSTNLYNPTNITYDIGSVMPSPYTNTIFKAWTASSETSTNSKFCDDTFTTDLLPEPTYNGTNYTAYGFELEDAKLLIKWDFTYGPTNSP